jgi:hypothetical protein
MRGFISAFVVSSAMLVVLAPEVYPQAAPAQRGSIQAPDLDSVRFDLVTRLSVARTRPRNIDEWQKLATEVGLKPRDSTTWELKTTAGTLRALPSFPGDRGSVWLILFPASAEPVPDALLSHFLKDARYASLDGDTVEIGLASPEQLEGGGTKTKNITVTLAGGRLVASRIVFDWK